jgi:hypothetical protein
MKRIAQLALATPAALLATALTTLPALANSLTYATRVESYTPGSGSIAADRTITSEALGAPQLSSRNNDFLSLGFGGEAVFSFNTLFSNQVTVWETTWGNYSRQSSYDERVKVYVGNDLNSGWKYIGTILNIEDGAYNSPNGFTLQIGDTNTYQYVRLVDDSPFVRDRDGFDVNAVAVQSAAVPEPTTMAGLAIAGGGMVLARRRRKQ